MNLSGIAASLIQKAANDPINTQTLNNGGLLNPEQARRFLRQTFDKAPLTARVRHVMKEARKGEINKLTMGRRILRPKVEGQDDGYRATIGSSQITYDTVALKLPWETTGELLRENIEGRSLSETITDMMTTQLAVDLEDLFLNGDEDTPETDKDGVFLSMNDGWVKQIKNGGHVYDASTAAENTLIDTFFEAVNEIPQKFIDALGGLHWIMHPKSARYWKQYLTRLAALKGGHIDNEIVNHPGWLPIIETPLMPEDCVLLTEPQNLIVVNTFELKVRSTNEGREALMKDMTYFATFLDFDTIIEEIDATGVITDIPWKKLAGMTDSAVTGGTDGESTGG